MFRSSLLLALAAAACGAATRVTLSNVCLAAT